MFTTDSQTKCLKYLTQKPEVDAWHEIASDRESIEVKFKGQDTIWVAVLRKLVSYRVQCQE